MPILACIQAVRRVIFDYDDCSVCDGSFFGGAGVGSYSGAVQEGHHVVATLVS